jgi:cation diffusion facilitator family transporter
MSGVPPTLTPAESARLTRLATVASVVVAFALVTMKAFAWTASGSVALLASLVDSGLDLLASLVTLFAVRYAAAPPDSKHRFGHGKAEAFASLMQAGLVFASAALIAREAFQAIAAPHVLRAEGWGVAVMIVSIALTAGLIAFQGHVVRRTNSVAISGDRAHYASDLGSNLVALVGIGAAAYLGLHGLDAPAGLLIAAILLWGAVGVFREAARQLMDRELPEDARARIKALVREDPRVVDVHQLRTRASGPYVHMQMHLDLDPQLSLEAAHKVIVDAERRILEAFPSADILIHPDPRGRAEPHGGAFPEQHARA